MQTQLADRFGRRFPYLRLSLTEACNFRCSYCLPQGYRAGAKRPDMLGVDEIARLLAGFARLGVSKVRLTGGEPTLRHDLIEIIGTVAATPGIERVAMTSNGALLERRWREWRDAGLGALNVSVDALDPARFAAITGADQLDGILRGIDCALAEGFTRIKLNAVLLRGLNDDQLPAFLDYLRARPVAVRFIELMRTGDNQAYFERHHYRAELLETTLLDAGWSSLARAPDAGPAREYAHPDYAGRIGIIAPYSRDFCASCNRLRVTARGDLRLCLFGELGIPLRPLLQSADEADALQATLLSQLGLKAASHALERGATGLTPHLASIGG